MVDERWWTRSIGTLLIDNGIIIRAVCADDDHTFIEVAPGTPAGAIVRDPETKRWRYDSMMREVLHIAQDPDFTTDAEAGRQLRQYLPPLDELHARLQLCRETKDRSN